MSDDFVVVVFVSVMPCCTYEDSWCGVSDWVVEVTSDSV